ncbi:L,D-transpeptidase family protein [Verrucomicrobium sp. BvORR106]|uniref:L,D-transpeptidase family protein n=1 Tax=Verrucomicrobium sp. BvORR106 TaxID=1403819 RepID=UPI00056FC0E9|nr:L,D-transpeptidase family protein [Verrucomicrobium sp. BvORR106]
MKRLPCILLTGTAFLAFGVWTGSLAEEPEIKFTPEVESMLRLQVFLDRAGYGPGKIDGKDGQFTRTARELYEKAHGPVPEQELKVDASAPAAGPEGSQALTEYVVTKEDASLVGEVPEKPEDQAGREWLPYAHLAEAVAEKFHCDEKFFRQLNGGKADALKVGDEVLVPKVEPFDVNTVKTVAPGHAMPQGEEKTLVRILSSNNMLEVVQGDKIAAAFPVTIGSTETGTPTGTWTIKGMERFPKFRRDEKMLKEGERSGKFLMIPPGPNNDVGVIWIELDRKGLGIHGTKAPDSIGRSESHGCIRLANWDVLRLAGLVKAGVKVEVR